MKENMKDVVCDKEVSESTPYQTVFGDRRFYFCSKTCETDFINNPTRFIEKTGAAIGSTEGSPKITESGQVKPSRT